MLTKKMKEQMDRIAVEAVHILEIAGEGKDTKETYERAQATMGMLDIGVRMLISERAAAKANSKN